MSLFNTDVVNYTVKTSKEDAEPASNTDIMTHEESLYVMRILMYGVTPGISVLGIVGNIFSIIILLRHGLHKCSNILLICLAFTDLTFLVAFNSVPKILNEVVGVEYAWDYSKDASFTLYFFYNIFNVLDYGMSSISLTMPMLITLERLIAVYLPFKFHLIVTPTRTWCAVACLYLFWYTIYIYMQFWFTFTYTYSSEYNTSLGTIERSALYHETFHTVERVEELIDYCIMKIPPSFTLAGCIFISVKVKMASVQRKKMTQSSSKTKDASSNRTTKMLLAVCVVYMVTCAVLSLPVYFPQLMSYTLLNDVPSNFGRVMYQVINIAICINSSANFVVYVGMNKNFRDTYKSLFVVCASKKA